MCRAFLKRAFLSSGRRSGSRSTPRSPRRSERSRPTFAAFPFAVPLPAVALQQPPFIRCLSLLFRCRPLPCNSRPSFAAFPCCSAAAGCLTTNSSRPAFAAFPFAVPPPAVALLDKQPLFIRCISLLFRRRPLPCISRPVLAAFPFAVPLPAVALQQPPCIFAAFPGCSTAGLTQQPPSSLVYVTRCVLTLQ